MPFRRETQGEVERGREKAGREREGWREGDGETGRKRIKTTVIPVQTFYKVHVYCFILTE